MEVADVVMGRCGRLRKANGLVGVVVWIVALEAVMNWRIAPALDNFTAIRNMFANRLFLLPQREFDMISYFPRSHTTDLKTKART